MNLSTKHDVKLHPLKILSFHFGEDVKNKEPLKYRSEKCVFQRQLQAIFSASRRLLALSYRIIGSRFNVVVRWRVGTRARMVCINWRQGERDKSSTIQNYVDGPKVLLYT